jgi:signal transduction histidine kinase
MNMRSAETSHGGAAAGREGSPATLASRMSGRRIAALARRAVADIRILLSGGVGAIYAVPLLAVSLVAVISSRTPIGMPLFTGVTQRVRRQANLARRQAADRLGRPVPEPYRSVPGPMSVRGGTLLRDPATWRDLAWLAVRAFVGFNAAVIGLAVWGGTLVGPFVPLIRALVPDQYSIGYVFSVTSMPLAFLAAPTGVVVYGLGGWWACRGMVLGQAKLAEWLLAPTAHARLTQQVSHLATTRADTVDARAAELRRIERDLHDGAQARLVSLAMSLGMAEEEFSEHPETAKKLVAEARDSASKALGELRDLVRGIHPPVLADRGLAGGIEALALASPLPVEVDINLDGRLPPPLESALYFVAAEALTNIARHADATWAFVRLWRDDQQMLRMLVHDDGHGGADPARGSGLRGIQHRMAAFDGRLTVSSPEGGPTELFVELRCQT